MNIGKLLLIFSVTIATTSFAAKYEAEAGTLINDAKKVSDSGASGGAYVDMQSGNLSINNVNAEKTGKYSLKVRYKVGDYKENLLKVNGASAGTLAFEASNNWTDLSTVVTLNAGNNTILIEKYWGWVSVDYIEVNPYVSEPFKISSNLVTPNATESAQKLYTFLVNNFGKKTISGVMTGDMGSYSMGADFKTHDDVKEIYSKGGKYPALVGVDFLFASGPNANSSWNQEYTNKALSLARNLWKQGGIPNFTWHWKDPLDKQDAFYIKGATDGTYTDFDFATAFKSGTTEWNTESAAYKGIIADVDHIADYFLDLQKDGIAGIFRPLHEAGGKWFWWSINSGKQFAALYRLVFDRMVKVKGVKNMIWVYNPISPAVYDWDPGADYYDVIAIDIYNSANDHSSCSSDFDKFKSASKSSKIIALTENGPIPDINNMVKEEAMWSWWMPWYSTWGSTFSSQTSNAMWKSNLNDERVITLEDMPGWASYTPVVNSSSSTPATTSSSSESIASSSSSESAITSSSSNETQHLAKTFNLNVSSEITGIFDMNGHYMGSESALTKLPQGRYIIRSRAAGKTTNSLYLKK